MRSNEEAILMARFCVEDGNSEKIVYNARSAIEFERFRSIFRYLVNSYNLISKEELEEKYLKIAEVV